MCQWCTAHGKGKKWFTSVKNFVRKFDEMEDWLKEWNANYRSVQSRLWGPVSKELDVLKYRLSPRLEELANQDWEIGFSQYHSGQTVTLEEAKEIVRTAGDVDGVVKLACTCRKYKRGGKYIGPENTLCLGISAYASMYHEHPERIWKEHKIETISIEQAIEHLEKCSAMGLAHDVSYVGSPAYVSKICNCEYPTCVWMQWRLDWGIKGILRKGHYVASLDLDRCNGCGACVKRCHFRAISLAPTYGKVVIKQNRCFGCGQCELFCEQKAIKMVGRESIPILKENW